MNRSLSFVWQTLCLSLLTLATTGVQGRDLLPPHPYPPGQVPYLSPRQSMKKIVLPKGYHLQLVLSEPTIKEPVVCVFDGDGDMYVAEMRSYMQNIDGTGELKPVSRISMHVDTNGDGIYDRNTVFADHLLLPRMILPLGKGALLVGVTDSNDLYLFRDTNGDGVADTKQLVYNGGPRGGNLEHQPSGLIWCLDNWIYTTYNAYRLRWTGHGFLKEPTAPNGGQWGLTQDDYGKLWIVNAGSELGPLNFQEPIVYGAFNIPDQFPPDFRTVWPLVRIPDVQGGPARFRPKQKTLNHFTATCGACIFRGDRLPADLRGDLLFAEPVGRLIRRAKITVRDGLTYLRNAYHHSEFIRSYDPNFRPVNMTTGPDGCLYIVDMYRGIIQEGNWVRKGSYLRPQVEKFGLENNFGRGRIYRLVHDGYKPGPQPHMYEDSSAKLVTYLAHPNGWWRDEAQKLLILRKDHSVVPALEQMAHSHPNFLARQDALWTLEGLDALDPQLVREKLKDTNPHVRIAAIRVSETLYKEGNHSLVPDVLALTNDPDPNVVIQVLMTAKLLGWPNYRTLIRDTMLASHSRGVQAIGSQLLNVHHPSSSQLTVAQRKLLRQGRGIYEQLCFACHGPDGHGAPMQGAPKGTTMAPALAGAPLVRGHPDGMINVVLHGLTGPVDGKTYTALMVPMQSNDDQWIASVISYVRNSFGNHGSFVTPHEVASVRDATRHRENPWTLDELRAVVPQAVGDRRQWKLSASLDPMAVSAAIDGNPATRYTTGITQRPGMWFQIELPRESTIEEIDLDTTPSPNDYPRGYKVQLSDDGHDWSKPVATGHGHSSITTIHFAPRRAKYIRITQTGKSDHYYWSIHELHLYTQPQALASR